MHLSETQLLDYRNNALSSEELLSVSDHLTSCDACRGKCGIPLGAVVWTNEAYSGHLSFAEMAAIANDTPRQIHDKVVEQHLSECDPCALQVRDLVELRRDLGEIPPAVASPGAGIWEKIRNSLQPRFLVPVFGLLLVIVLGAVWFLNQEPEPQSIVEVPVEFPSVAETETPVAVVEDPAAPTEDAPEIVAAIRDGRGKIEIDSGGEVTGSPAAWSEKIRKRCLPVI
jgi:hypothetical protein